MSATAIGLLLGNGARGSLPLEVPATADLVTNQKSIPAPTNEATPPPSRGDPTLDRFLAPDGNPLHLAFGRVVVDAQEVSFGFIDRNYLLHVADRRAQPPFFVSIVSP
jgi:hypothetical protein